jgi:acetyl/propionyl-CoA carboxylase alpha subunit
MARRILIANRGEIAARIARTAEELGYEPVRPQMESFLDIEAIVRAAHDAGVWAVHPGYGFLAENPEFAEACERAGIVFIGPTPEAMRATGDKPRARQTARAAGVPVARGTEDANEALRTVGFPMMIKAAAGGGGKGMRRVEHEREFASAVAAARREAAAAFGDDRLLFEQVIPRARHVEVQVFGDGRGRVVAFGERDCSLQRRFQKIVEEAPSPAVDSETRQRLEEAACAIARAVGYRNAGTVEFLLAADGSFIFLEMNARLQVEHPVTECVTGLDLVRLQIEIAEGKPLPDRIPEPRGHAIEARVYAERPWDGFLPATGRILVLRFPEGVRVDHDLHEGDEVGPQFDPMIAKIVAHAPDREHARRRLLRALRETVILGVETNIAYLAGLLESAEFRSGDVTVERLPEVPLPEPPPEALAAALAARAAPGAGGGGPRSVWDTLGEWRLA